MVLLILARKLFLMFEESSNKSHDAAYLNYSTYPVSRRVMEMRWLGKLPNMLQQLSLIRKLRTISYSHQVRHEQTRLRLFHLIVSKSSNYFTGFLERSWNPPSIMLFDISIR